MRARFPRAAPPGSTEARTCWWSGCTTRSRRAGSRAGSVSRTGWRPRCWPRVSSGWSRPARAPGSWRPSRWARSPRTGLPTCWCAWASPRSATSRRCRPAPSRTGSARRARPRTVWPAACRRGRSCRARPAPTSTPRPASNSRTPSPSRWCSRRSASPSACTPTSPPPDWAAPGSPSRWSARTAPRRRGPGATRDCSPRRRWPSASAGSCRPGNSRPASPRTPAA